MTSENPPSPASDLKARIDLIDQLEDGHLDGLTCPMCDQKAIRVRFTQPACDEYRMWFICDVCGFEMRVQNSEKPKYYSEGILILNFKPEMSK